MYIIYGLIGLAVACKNHHGKFDFSIDPEDDDSSSVSKLTQKVRLYPN